VLARCLLRGAAIFAACCIASWEVADHQGANEEGRDGATSHLFYVAADGGGRRPRRWGRSEQLLIHVRVWEVGDGCLHALFFLLAVFLALLIGAAITLFRGGHSGLSDFIKTTAITVILVIPGFVVCCFCSG
jgi:hypothetical protein